MGTGYTRNDTPNNIADGNVINASDLDGEFDAVQAAFNGSTGHSHDGTTGEGPQIATAGLADNAVTTAKITDANVTTAKIADSNVTTAKIANSNVTLAKMAANSVDSDQYVDGSIDTAHIANGAVTSAKLDTNIQIAGTLGVTGETTLTTHLNMGDNDIIKLGDGADLQIYHDGSHSYVKDLGTGNLNIQSNGVGVVIADSSASDLAVFNATSGVVSLFYSGAEKLKTTATGIDVTGTAVTDGLTVAGNVSIDGGTIKLDGNYPVGSGNVALGDTALDSISGANNNVAIGNQSLTSNTSGSSLTAIGGASLYSNTTASNNVAVGFNAGYSITEGANNSVLGTYALDANTTGNNNTAIGYLSLSANTTASDNTAIGRNALESNTTGSFNTAVGKNALDDNTTGANNTAVGYQSLYLNTTASYSTAVGYQAGYSNETGAENTLIGAFAGYTGTSATRNTFIGQNAGYHTTGSYNTFIGRKSDGGGAGQSITTGTSNVIIGGYNGNSGGVDIRTSSNNIVLSDGDGNVRFYIDNNANLLWGGITTRLFADATSTVNLHKDGDSVLRLNRGSNDGEIVRIGQDGVQEGTISVAGTTVSYNGGHLSRWSQLTDNTRDNTIVKGTVMTNLDQMAEWTTDGVTEDNEQLNCMAVSSVEGDANVAGVFVNWDNDDDYNDMNIAMTGDMVIRIAQGTTVARGDLLMSAGDGTAKPQGDDIVRSKTIAKVTSTNVSHTYDDGTYLVPCVLMAC